MTEFSRDAEPGTYLQDTNERTHVHDDHSTDIEKDAVNHTSDTLQECIDSGLLDLTHSSLGQTFSIDSGSSLDDDICCDEGSCSNATIFDDANSSLHHSGYSGTRSSEGCSCDDGTQSCFEHRFYDGTLSNFDCTFLHNASSSPSTSSYILNNDGAAGDSVSVFQWPSRGSATITDVPSGTIGETADTADLSREELLTKITHTLKGIQIQEAYIQRQEAKKQRNTEMIAEVETLIEAKKDNVKQLQAECAECETEIAKYEADTNYLKNEIANSSMKHFMAKQLYEDLLQQKDELERERDNIRCKLNEGGIPDDVIDDFIKNKRSLDHEKAKKKMLLKKLKLYQEKTTGYDVIGDTTLSGSDCVTELFTDSTSPSVQDGIFRPINSEAGGDGFKLPLEPDSPESVFTNHSLERSLSCSPEFFYL